MGGQFLPRHRACDCRLVEFGNRSFGNLLAVAENGQALADFELIYGELDPDVFGEELERDDYANVERIAVIGLIAVKR